MRTIETDQYGSRVVVDADELVRNPHAGQAEAESLWLNEWGEVPRSGAPIGSSIMGPTASLYIPRNRSTNRT